MDNEIKMKLFNYLRDNISSYTRGEVNNIIEYFDYFHETQAGPGDMLQVLSALNLYKDEKNMYLGILNLIKKYFTLEKNILEIGSGHYPALAALIDKEQSILGGGTVTAYDDKLIPTQVGKIKYNRKKLTTESFTPYDLIVGAFPCEATELMIRKSNEEHKPFLIAICECVHLPESVNLKYRRTPMGYHRYLEDIAYDTLDKDAELEIEYLDSKYCNPNPVFIKTYKK